MTPILLDTIVLIVVVLSAAAAFFRGFVKEMLTIVNLGGGAAAAWFAGPALVPTFKSMLGVTDDPETTAPDIWGIVPPEIMANALAYGAVFFGAFIILSLAGMAVSTGIKAMGLGGIDRILGVGFGLLRGFLIVFLVYLPFAHFEQNDKLPQWADGSISIVIFDSAYTHARDYFNKDATDENGAEKEIDPDSLRGKIKSAGDKIIRKIDTGTPEDIRPADDSGLSVDETQPVEDILTDVP